MNMHWNHTLNPITGEEERQLSYSFDEAIRESKYLSTCQIEGALNSFLLTLVPQLSPSLYVLYPGKSMEFLKYSVLSIKGIKKVLQFFIKKSNKHLWSASLFVPSVKSSIHMVSFYRYLLLLIIKA